MTRAEQEYLKWLDENEHVSQHSAYLAGFKKALELAQLRVPCGSGEFGLVSASSILEAIRNLDK
jgi:hypothetical protein